MLKTSLCIAVAAFAAPAAALMRGSAPQTRSSSPGLAPAVLPAAGPVALGVSDMPMFESASVAAAPAAALPAAAAEALLVESKAAPAAVAAGQALPVAPESRFAATQEIVGSAGEGALAPALAAPADQRGSAKSAAALSAAFDGVSAPGASAAAPRFTILPAGEDDLADIAEMVREVSLDEMGKDDGGYARTGFLTPEDPVAYYGAYMKDPNAHFIIVRDEDGRAAAFSMYFTKGIIKDPKDPGFELHALVRGEIERRYGKEQDMIIYAHAVARRGVHGGGLGKKMFAHVLADARSRGIDFLVGRIIDDRYLDGTVLEGQPHRLNNVASRGAFTTLPGVVRIMERFVSSRELAAYLRDGSLPRWGVHNWQMFGISFDPNKPMPVDLPTPAENAPPAKP